MGDGGSSWRSTGRGILSAEIAGQGEVPTGVPAPFIMPIPVFKNTRDVSWIEMAKEKRIIVIGASLGHRKKWIH